MDIRKLWAAMEAHHHGPEPICIEINDDRICLFTQSCLNEGVQEGLFVSGAGRTLEEAFANFEKDLEGQLASN